MNTSRKHNRPGRRQTERERAPASYLKDGKGHKQGVFIHRMLSLQTEDSASHREEGRPGPKVLAQGKAAVLTASGVPASHKRSRWDTLQLL